MFCQKCGNQFPDSSQFCNQCGNPIVNNSQPKPVKTKSSTVTAIQVVCLVFLIVMGSAVFGRLYHGSEKFNPNSFDESKHKFNAALSNKTSETQSILTEALEVQPLVNRYYTIVIQKNWTNARIVGDFKAAGGSGNDIEVFVRNQPKGGKVSYASGRISAGHMDVQLQPGTYYLIFDNGFSVLSTKVISGQINLLYEH